MVLVWDKQIAEASDMIQLGLKVALSAHVMCGAKNAESFVALLSHPSFVHEASGGQARRGARAQIADATETDSLAVLTITA